MPFAVIATDKPGAADLRARTRPEHLDYLEANLDRLVAAGALFDDEGASATGSLYLVDSDDREAAKAFIANDPYTRVGLFGSIEIVRWRRGVLDHKSFLVRS